MKMLIGRGLIVVFLFLDHCSKVLLKPIEARKGVTSAAFQTVMKMLYDPELSFKEESLTPLVREKRSSQFEDSSKMGQQKMFQMIIQMVKNIFVKKKSSVGPNHPLHPLVPYIFVKMVKEEVFNSVSPDINSPPKKNT